MGEWAKCCCGFSLMLPGPSRLLAFETLSQESLCCLQITFPNAGTSLSPDAGGHFLLHLVPNLPNTLNLAQSSLWTLVQSAHLTLVQTSPQISLNAGSN